MKIIRNDRAEPMTAQRPPPADARASLASIVIRLAILIVAVLVVLGLIFNR